MGLKSINRERASSLSFKNRFTKPDINWLMKQCYFQIRHEALVGLSACRIKKTDDFSPELIKQAISLLVADGFYVKESEGEIVILWV